MWFFCSNKGPRREKSHKRVRPVKAGRNRLHAFRPTVEQLEELSLPTVLFTPHFGADTLLPSPNGDFHFQTLSSPNVYLIFWGTYWQTNSQQATALSTDIQTVLNSAYTSGLTVYGSDGKAVFGGSYVDAASDPPPGFNPDDYQNQSGIVQSEITNAINTAGSGILPPPSGGHSLYTVITATGTGASYNLPGTTAGVEMISLSFVPNNTAGAAFVFSHELAEAMSDPFSILDPSHNFGVTIQQPSGVTANLDNAGQINDSEATAYSYQLGGPTGQLLAPYWNNAVDSSGNYLVGQGNFIVPDGNTEQVTLQAAPGSWTVDSQGNEHFNGQYTLAIGPTDGTITFNDSNIGLQIDINGQQFSFGFGTIVGTTIDLGSGNDTVNVEGTMSTTTFSDPVTINLGSGTDTVNITPAIKDVANILAKVSIFGRIGGDDTLNVNDQDAPFAVAWNVTNSSFANNSGATLDYTGLSNVVINGGSKSNTFNVQSTAGPIRIGHFLLGTTTTTINSGGPDTIIVGDTHGVQDIQGQLVVNGHIFDGDTLLLNDQADTAARTVAVTGSAVTGLAPAEIDYNDCGTVTLSGGSGGDTFNVQSTAGPIILGHILLGTTTTFINSHGSDTINVGDAHGAQDIQGQLVVNGFLDNTTLNLNDQADSKARTVTITQSSVTGLAPAEIDYTSCGAVTLSDGSGGDTVGVQSTAGPLIAKVGFITILLGTTTTTLNSNGKDTINVGDAGGVQDIQGQLVIKGSATAQLSLNDQPDTMARIVTVTSTAVKGLAPAEIDYANVAGLTVNGARFLGEGNSITVNSTPAGMALTVNAGLVNDITVIVIPGVGGPLTVAPGVGDTTYLDDGPASDNSRIYTINSTSVTRTGGFDMNLVYPSGHAINEGFGLFTGNGFNETVNIQSTLAGTGWALSASGGSNVFNVGDPVQGLAPVQGSLDVTDESGSNSFHLNDQPDKAAETFTFGFDTATALDKVSWAQGGFLLYDNTGPTLVSLEVNAGSGNTSFKVQTISATTPVTLKGGNGVNTLDYSQFVGNVTVDLPLGLATGFTGGISNIQNVTGSQGNDLLVGDANPNVLIGGTGRNVLIGGAGADRLDGSDSKSDNLLIGGTTNFDTNLAALDAVFAEWTRTDLSFQDRFSDLSTGKNLAGKTPLNEVGSKLILLTTKTVHADGLPDTLLGSKNTDPATGTRVHNGFFFDAADVLVNFLSTSDRKTKV
jgi:hypothetical protein